MPDVPSIALDVSFLGSIGGFGRYTEGLLHALLRANPKTFMKDHYLKIHVVTSAVFGPANYYFGGAVDNNDTTQALRRGAGCFTRGSKVLKFVPHSMLFQLAPGDNNVQPQNLAATPVWVVPAELASTVANYAALAGGAVNGGSDIMITTLLNGCSFCCAMRSSPSNWALRSKAARRKNLVLSSRPKSKP